MPDLRNLRALRALDGANLMGEFPNEAEALEPVRAYVGTEDEHSGRHWLMASYGDAGEWVPLYRGADLIEYARNRGGSPHPPDFAVERAARETTAP